MTTTRSVKTVSETLSDLRNLFDRNGVEEWEPIRDGLAYSVRYRRGAEWVLIGCQTQGSMAKNARVCFQVVQNLFLWANRGVTGVSQGATFIHGSLATVGDHQSEDSLAEAYATIGVDPDASWDEINDVYRAKIKNAHPDAAQDAEERRHREDRSQRLNMAHDQLEKARG